MVSQNRFEVLSSRVMRYGVEIRRQEVDIRVTRAEYSRRFLSKLHSIEYITTYLQEIPQRIR